MKIPEVKLKQFVDALISVVRDDYAFYPDKKNTLLWEIFGENNYEGYNFYNQAVSLIIDHANDKARHVESRLAFDPERVMVPTIHITMPSEEPAENGIGFDPFVAHDHMTYSRRQKATYQIIVTSDNKFETLILYYLLNMLFICFVDDLSLDGLENLTIRGTDLRIASEAVPQGVFARGISVDVSFDRTIRVSNYVLSRIREIIATGTPMEKSIDGEATIN